MKLKNGTIVKTENVQVANKMKNLYKFFKSNKILTDIDNYNEKLLDIYSAEVLNDIKNGKNGWEKKLPSDVTVLIKKKKLFGYK